MTIICVSRREIAADSGVWLDDMTFATVEKIRPAREGGFVAAAGEFSVIERFYAWMRDGGEPPAAKDEDFSALWLKPDGSIWRCRDEFYWHCTGEFFAAEGAHAGFAMGAMAAGASAEEAVHLVIKHGAYARGPVVVKRLEGL